MPNDKNFRHCFREPIPEIMEAANYLDDAVSSYFDGDHKKAEALIIQSDMPAIREWTESIWGKNSPYLNYRSVESVGVLPVKTSTRMPTTLEKAFLRERDGYHCRFCGIPVIRKEVRLRLMKIFPLAISWGNRNHLQHAAFQAMWLQYDHVLPHAKGGTNELDNLLITCAPCNFGRMSYTLDEVGIIDPRPYPIKASQWDGLERILSGKLLF